MLLESIWNVMQTLVYFFFFSFFFILFVSLITFFGIIHKFYYTI